MKTVKIEDAKARILILYKVLIQRHLARGYTFDLIELPSENKGSHLYYHLRFTKNKGHCKYYKVMIDLDKFFNLDLSLDEEISTQYLN